MKESRTAELLIIEFNRSQFIDGSGYTCRNNAVFSQACISDTTLFNKTLGYCCIGDTTECAKEAHPKRGLLMITLHKLFFYAGETQKGTVLLITMNEVVKLTNLTTSLG